jgi:phosphatidylglycerophosphate synthase
MLTRWRALYERLSIPFGKASLRLGLTPNFWTLFSLFSGGLAAVAIAFGLLGWGLAMIIVMNITDMLDGATARAGNLGTPAGMILDHVCDRYGEFFLFAGYMMGGWISPLLALFSASGVIMASYVRSKAESTGLVKSCIVGLAGRQEKLILMMLGLIFFAFGQILIGQICIFLAGLISHITAYQRLQYARGQILAGARHDS